MYFYVPETSKQNGETLENLNGLWDYKYIYMYVCIYTYIPMYINPRMYNTIFKKSVYFKTFAKGGGGGIFSNRSCYQNILNNIGS